MTPVTAAAVKASLDQVRERIADAGGDPERVRVLAVTKGFGLDAVVAAVGAGLVDVGESYAQELATKAAGVADSITGDLRPRWWFIGHLQRNKVRLVAPIASCIATIDRPRLAAALAAAAPGRRVLVQVNVCDNPGQGGCRIDETTDLVARCRDLGLDCGGLLAIGRVGDAEVTRAGFERLVALADRLELPERCIGMSDDLEAAVAAGATTVRIGEALFGPRPSRDRGGIAPGPGR